METEKKRNKNSSIENEKRKKKFQDVGIKIEMGNRLENKERGNFWIIRFLKTYVFLNISLDTVPFLFEFFNDIIEFYDPSAKDTQRKTVLVTKKSNLKLIFRNH